MTLRDAIRSEMLTLVIEQNADLRSRLSLFADFVCEGCGCAVQHPDVEAPLCGDCFAVDEAFEDEPEYPAACISVGMRALCGRRILEGC